MSCDRALRHDAREVRSTSVRNGAATGERTHYLISGDLDTPSVDALPAKSRVFVVHGRDLNARDQVFMFLRSIGLDPIEWSQALQMTGKATPYIGEVLDAAFEHAQAILILMTPDEIAHLRIEFASSPGDPETLPAEQPRPNVLFEAGMALGRKSDRTVIVEVGNIRPFSDIQGKHVVRLDDSPQRRKDLAQRLRTAGCSVDLSGETWLTVGDFAKAKSNPVPEQPSNDAVHEPVLVQLRRIYDRLDHQHARRLATDAPGPFAQWPRLEKAAHAFPPGTVLLAVGEMGAGKTSLGLNVALQVAVSGKGRVLYVATRENSEQTTLRALSIASSVPTSALATGDLEELDFARLAPSMNVLAESSLYVIEDGSNTLDIAIRAIESDEEIQLVVLDEVAPNSSGAERFGRKGTRHSDDIVRRLGSVAAIRLCRLMLIAEPMAMPALGHHADVLLELSAHAPLSATEDWWGLEVRVAKGSRPGTDREWLQLNPSTGVIRETAAP
jgi:predicted nucleotide-binding protein